MSKSIQMARYGMAGAPRGEGIIDAFTGAVGGFLTGGFGGAIAGGMSGWKGTTKGMPGTGAKPPGPAITPGRPVINLPFDQFAGIGVNVGPFSAGFGQGTGVAVSPNGAVAIPAGYRLNKTDYFLKSGQYVPAGTRIVKKRRRNPLNPRAASRAMSRLTSAKKAMSSLNRVRIAPKKCCNK